MQAFISLLDNYLSTGYKSIPSSPCVLCVSVLLREAPNTDEQALLEKMLASINLIPNQNCIIKIDAYVPQQKMILSLNDQIKITTHHPKVLLQDASKKRPAWEDLKTFKAKIDA